MHKIVFFKKKINFSDPLPETHFFFFIWPNEQNEKMLTTYLCITYI